jgi:hypothetical protein
MCCIEMLYPMHATRHATSLPQIAPVSLIDMAAHVGQGHACTTMMVKALYGAQRTKGLLAMTPVPPAHMGTVTW